MYQPYDYEMDRRPSSTRSLADKSTFSHLAVPTEIVQIQVRGQESEDLADIEQTLKRGLEARQVSMRLARCEMT